MSSDVDLPESANKIYSALADNKHHMYTKQRKWQHDPSSSSSSSPVQQRHPALLRPPHSRVGELILTFGPASRDAIDTPVTLVALFHESRLICYLQSVCVDHPESSKWSSQRLRAGQFNKDRRRQLNGQSSLSKLIEQSLSRPKNQLPGGIQSAKCRRLLGGRCCNSSV